MRGLWVALPIAVLAGAACAARSAGSGDAEELTDSALGRLTYPAPLLVEGRVTLVEGEWKSASDQRKAWLTRTARGVLMDQRNDARPVAVVILFTDPGATGRFFDLVPVFADGGNTRVGRSTPFGDRVRPESLWIAKGRAYLRLVAHDTSDGLCCPTRREERRYRLVSDSLMLEHTELLARLVPEP